MDGISPTIRNLCFLDVYGYSRQADFTDVEIKLFWNVFLSPKYGADKIQFEVDEKRVLFQVRQYLGFPVPYFFVLLVELMSQRYFDEAFKRSPFKDVSYEYFLIDYILYVAETIFGSDDFSDETWGWINSSTGDVSRKKIPLSKLICSSYWANQVICEKYDLETDEGRLGLIGFFIQWRMPKYPSYRHPDYLLDLLDSYFAGCSYGKDIGLSNLVAAIWFSEKEKYSEWLDIYFRDSAQQFVEWFEKHKKNESFGVKVGSCISEVPPLAANDSNFAFEDGFNIVGWISAENGIGEDARVAYEVINSFTNSVGLVDAGILLPPIASKLEIGRTKRILNTPKYSTDIVFLDAATQFRYYAAEVMKRKKIDRKVVVVAPWELSSWSHELSFVFDHVDVFWAASRFIYEAFSPYFSKKEIYLAPPAVIIPERELDDFDVGRVDGNFTFLTTFDGQSSIHRKNPLAAVNAFLQAFPAVNGDSVRLIVKTMNFTGFNETLTEMRRLVSGDPRIEVIDQALSREQLYSLIRKTHCFVSLHRSEGFGRNIAEMMLFNRPVIVSNYSGNVDFCDHDSSYLVEGKMVPVQGNYWYSEGQTWFDADVESATEQMRSVYLDRKKASMVAEKGRVKIAKFHSLKATGERYKDILSRI